MTAIRNVAVIDVGKTNGKVALFDVVEGRESHVHSTANTVLRDGPYPHYDIEGLWNFFLRSLREIGTRAREQMELHTRAMHDYGLWATVRKAPE